MGERGNPGWAVFIAGRQSQSYWREEQGTEWPLGKPVTHPALLLQGLITMQSNDTPALGTLGLVGKLAKGSWRGGREPWSNKTVFVLMTDAMLHWAGLLF